MHSNGLPNLYISLYNWQNWFEFISQKTEWRSVYPENCVVDFKQKLNTLHNLYSKN